MAYTQPPPYVPNDPLTLAKNLRFVGPDGNLVTRQFPADYIQTIGNSLSTQIDNYNVIISTLSNIENEITVLQTDVANILASGSTSMPSVSTGCLSSGSVQPLPVVTSMLVNNSCAYNAALDTPSNIYQAILTENPNTLNTGRQYGAPTGQMANLTGWSSAPGTMANAINNLWLTVLDLRAGMALVYSMITPSCANVTVGFIANIPSYSTGINIYFAGYTFIPSGYSDNGSTIQVSDSAGNITSTGFNIINASTSGSVNIPISGTALLPNSNYTITVTSNVKNTTWNVYCAKTVIQTLTNSITSCPVMNLSSTTTTVAFVMNPLITTNITYSVQLLSSGSTVLQTQTFTNPTGVQAGTFTGLTISTLYYVRVTSTIPGESPVTCASQPITTASS
jgi:hypothetical protein